MARIYELGDSIIIGVAFINEQKIYIEIYGRKSINIKWRVAIKCVKLK